MSDIDKQKKEDHIKRRMQFAPDKEVHLDKELFLAEYNTLRSEILQRLSQQTTLYQIAITAWGLILGYALERTDDQRWFHDVILICVYPMLAFLITSGWAFNQIRIGQIAQYLRAREEIITEQFGLIWWENYIKDEPSLTVSSDKENKNFLHKHGKIKPAKMIILGTQMASIAVALILLYVHRDNINTLAWYFAIIFICTDILVTYLSLILLRKSVGS